MKRRRHSGRTDRLDPQRARGRRLGGRPGPHARRRRAAGPPLEVQVRGHDGVRPEAAQAARGGEPAPEALRPRTRAWTCGCSAGGLRKAAGGLWKTRLASGRRLRILNVDAGFSRPRVGQLVATSITGARLALFLDGRARPRRLPRPSSATTAPSSPARRCAFGASGSARP